MDIAPVEIRYYQTASEKRPFQVWLDSLDASVQQIVAVRLARIRRGLFGDAEPVGEGVFELKIDVGPGHRIYLGRDGKVVVILLHAGDKKRQSADIERAQGFWQDYLRRTRK
ncbi:MAG: type II toxin-antitoxin system RelE/ParE family toxin [Elusimicrobia bacterium]|nr:type II toxin-antitoxin system RelE/ParE family toxin [Elusimicrobiota bacterium]